MESDLQRAVCRYLSVASVPWARNHTGARGRVRFGLRIPKVDAKPETRGGGPDLFVAPGGVRVFVIRSVADARQALGAVDAEPCFFELKDGLRDGTKLSRSQIAWIDHMGGMVTGE